MKNQNLITPNGGDFEIFDAGLLRRLGHGLGAALGVDAASIAHYFGAAISDKRVKISNFEFSLETVNTALAR